MVEKIDAWISLAVKCSTCCVVRLLAGCGHPAHTYNVLAGTGQPALLQIVHPHDKGFDSAAAHQAPALAVALHLLRTAAVQNASDGSRVEAHCACVSSSSLLREACFYKYFFRVGGIKLLESESTTNTKLCY